MGSNSLSGKTRSGRRAVLTAAFAALSFALLTPLSAFAAPPGLAVLVKDGRRERSRLVAQDDQFATCKTGDTGTFKLIAWSPDPLGFPVFQDFGINTPIKAIWDFGSATPASPLDAFSLTPTVTFSRNHSSLVTVTVYGTNGQSSSYTFEAIAVFADGCVR